jgi:hypothetical protein
VSVTPKEILETAKKLLGDPSLESDLRSAASRAYYAALHATNQAIPETFTGNHQTSPSPQSSHDFIIGKADRLRKAASSGKIEATELYAILPKMKKIRVMADYRLDEKIESTIGNHAVAQAERVLFLCDNISRKLNTSVP